MVDREIRVPPAHRIDRRGTNTVEAIVNNDLEWIFRGQEPDYGIDAQFEVVDDNEVPTGRLIAIQIKSGTSHFKRENEEGFVISLEERHIKYWLRHALPVIIVAYNPDLEVAFWVHVRELISLLNFSEFQGQKLSPNWRQIYADLLLMDVNMGEKFWCNGFLW